MKKFQIILILALTVAFVAACVPQAAPTEPAPTVPPPPQPTAFQPPPEATATQPPPDPTPEPIAAYSPEPVAITFQASDGQELAGVFLPASVENAPVVVLMHQINLNGPAQWEVIAAWLQNRGELKESYDNPWNAPFRDPSWFPPVPEALQVSVFYFTFRGCDTPDGCPGFNAKAWQLDAIAAVQTAASQPGVDPARVIAIGTSIGADGVVDGCSLALANGGISLPCLAAMPVSPGGYLDMAYPGAVEAMLATGSVNVTCVAPEKEANQKDGCLSYDGDGYAVELVPNGDHGIFLANPALSPDLLTIMLDFLTAVPGIG